MFTVLVCSRFRELLTHVVNTLAKAVWATVTVQHIVLVNTLTKGTGVKLAGTPNALAGVTPGNT